MKKLYILFILCAFFFSAKAQECDLRLDSVTCYENKKPKSISYLFYNQKDSLIKRNYYKYNKTPQQRNNSPSTEILYKYDEKGNKIEEIYKYYSESASDYYSRHYGDDAYSADKVTYIFNEDNRITEIHYFKKDYKSKDWTLRSKEKFTYNENGQVKSKTLSGPRNNSLKNYLNDLDNYVWVILDIEEYEYDKDGFLIVQERTGDMYDDKMEYKYNDKGEEKEVIVYYCNETSGCWEKYSQYISEYDDKGSTTKSLILSFNKEGEISETKTNNYKYTYNDCGLKESLIIPRFGLQEEEHYKYYYSQKQKTNR